ncbi:hypothetical protein Hlac_1482 [Halorubrum lacusprofundi ATCC 49239]|jgi:hypothetical protein|uniref:Uncharacterized protein n=1 Tax=Halorubrum lacusprofundi (strain ATCC 49239 / DSM 5036 / JCM 8891 / ACAM 34) TaxID=416348 RepID=B9LNY2_HALLT|nr:hypothetical protein Hlac_1482 [Halorubrum lacusprofundi ATCC 49239]
MGVHGWPVLKQYILGESDIPPKYRERIELPSRRL